MNAITATNFFVCEFSLVRYTLIGFFIDSLRYLLF